MTETHVQAKDTIELRDFIPAILKRMWRFPSIYGTVRSVLGLKGEDHLSLGTYLERNAEEFPEGQAILFEDESYTHREFNEYVNRYANYLLDQGLKKGDRIIVLMENRPDLMFIIGAAAKIGAVASLINPNLRENALIHSVKLSTSRVAIIGEERLDVFEEIRPDVDPQGEFTKYFMPDKGDGSTPDGYIAIGEKARQCSPANPPTTTGIQLHDPFAYVFTSGTTGLPKAAVLTHIRWVSGGLGYGAILNMKPKDTFYITLPLSHSNSLSVGWASAGAYGATVALRRKFSASNFWKDVHKFNATAFNYVGELCRYLMNQPPRHDDRHNPIKRIIGNGLRPDIWRNFKRRFGIRGVYEFYGASETILSFVNLFNLDNTFGICLQKAAVVKYDTDTEAPVRDEKGFLQKVSRGEVGLLLGKITPEAPYIGYTDKEDSEKKILRNVFENGDAWFNTGDLIRDMGYRHGQFVDRLGDTFRWKGENVSTTEVEEVANTFNQVSISTVYGVSIPGTDGRAGMAAIMTSASVDDFDLKGLAATFRRSLPSYAIPTFIRLKSNLDTTATLKITKTGLKKEAYDPGKVSDPLYVLMQGDSEYSPLTEDICKKILNGEYGF